MFIVMSLFFISLVFTHLKFSLVYRNSFHHWCVHVDVCLHRKLYGKTHSQTDLLVISFIYIGKKIVFIARAVAHETVLKKI